MALSHLCLIPRISEFVCSLPELTYALLFTALGLLNVLYLTWGKFRFINDTTNRFPKVYNSNNVTFNASNYNSNTQINPGKEGQQHALNCRQQRNSNIWNSTSITSFLFNDLHTLVVIFWTNFTPVPKPVKRRSTSGMCGYTSVTVKTQWRPGTYWNKIGVYDLQRKHTIMTG